MQFRDRIHAGQLLAEKLKKYKYTNTVVYALPRGGVVTGFEIAKYLHVPLDLVITRKIGHPFQPEYAIAAITETGQIVGDPQLLIAVDDEWLEDAVEKERKEAGRRRRRYLHGRRTIPPFGRTVIIVDDGVATGLTLLAAIRSIKQYSPRKLIVAVPIISESIAKKILQEVNELVALDVAADNEYFGAVGAYYSDFPQIQDKEVIRLLNENQHFVSVDKTQILLSAQHGKGESYFIDKQ
jgi:putative phosphoribosyl transferase